MKIIRRLFLALAIVLGGFIGLTATAVLSTPAGAIGTLTAAADPTPTFSATDVEGTTVTVSWTNAAAIRVERNGTDSTGAGIFDFVPVGEPTSGTYTFENLIPDTTYTFSLFYDIHCGCSGGPPPLTTTVITHLGPPTFTVSSIGTNSVTVAWNQAMADTLGRSGFDSTGAGPWTSDFLDPLATDVSGSFTFLNLIPGDTYTFTLTYDCHSGGCPTPLTATATVPAPPPAPTSPVPAPTPPTTPTPPPVTTSPTTTTPASPTCDGTLPSGTVVGLAASSDDRGYWIANNQGLVVACGDAPNLGGLTTVPNHPIVGIATTSDGGGYYLVASDGGVFTFGDAAYYGSTGAIRLNRPIVGMAVDSATGGYWLVATDGGVFSFNAPFYGSTGNIALNQPIVGMAPSNGGHGYWLVASDGGVFSFNAPFLGSMGATRLNKPIVGMSADVATGGYWLVAADGGIFSFGAPFYGSTGAIVLNRPIVGMESNNTGSGYRFVASDGGIFDFGSSGFFGSAVAPLPVAPPPAPPAASPSCSVSLSNGSPSDGYEETATITSNVPNSAVTLTKAYKTTTSSDGGQTDASGNATIDFNIGSASAGYTVVVTASVGGATCRTSFTPV